MEKRVRKIVTFLTIVLIFQDSRCFLPGFQRRCETIPVVDTGTGVGFDFIGSRIQAVAVAIVDAIGRQFDRCATSFSSPACYTCYGVGSAKLKQQKDHENRDGRHGIG